MQDPDATRHAKNVLRRITDHICHSHQRLGTSNEPIGHVEVFHHPTSELSGLNYVMPRRATALVPSSSIRDGMMRLRAKQRAERMWYFRELYMPQLGQVANELGLSAELVTPIMARELGNFTAQPMPAGWHISRPQDGPAEWWALWSSDAFDVRVHPIMPLAIDQAGVHDVMREVTDLVLICKYQVLGVIRLTQWAGTANLLALAYARDTDVPTICQMLVAQALELVRHQGNDLVFATFASAHEHTLLEDLGFHQAGHIVSYAEATTISEAVPQVVEDPVLFI